jgi:hypothetical protein
MNSDQIALYQQAGELARRFNENITRLNEEPGPDRAWFFHPLGYLIDAGYSGEVPEYDRPNVEIDPRSANFAQMMGNLARTTKVWEDKKTLVTSGLCSRKF